MPISIVLTRSFITIYPLPFSKCIQNTKKDEGGIRPGSFEPLLVLAVLIPSYSPVLDGLSMILAYSLLREPPFPVDLTPLS